MKTTEADYPSRAVEATRRVLLELARVLGEYGDHIVLVGGWVPELLAPGAGHVGSTDVDLALDHVALSETGYARLRDLLENAGYRNDPDPARQFVFYRDVTLADGGTPDPVVVELDLLAAEYGGTGRNRRSQAVQGTRPRKARGADLAFERDLSVEVPLDGALPDGRLARAHIRVAGPVPFLVTKAAALALRDKPKDAYDVWFLLRHHPAGLDGLAAAVSAHATHGLVREALGRLADAFASVDHHGPVDVARFRGFAPGTDEYDQARQDAFQWVTALLDRVVSSTEGPTP